MAATFPLLGESTRTLANWPTQFVDVGLWAASALALHAAAHGRRGRALVALALALLCKEVAVVTGVLLPLLPTAARSRRERVRFAAACAAVIAAWGVVTLLVRRSAGLALPERIAQSPEALSAGILERFAWTLDATLRACWSLPRLPTPDATAAAAAVTVLVATAVAIYALRPDARRRLAASRAWLGWGAAWFALGTLSLTPIYPSWQPNRHQHASLGLGVASTVFLGAAHPALAVASTALRGAARTRTRCGHAHRGGRTRRGRSWTGRGCRGFSISFARHAPRSAASSQACPRGGRGAAEPAPRCGVRVRRRPRHSGVWYHDSSLRWMRFDEFRAAPDTPVTVILEGDPGREPPVGLVRPDAMRALFRVHALALEGRYAEMAAVLDRADSLQGALPAETFRRTSRTMRENALIELGRSAR